MKSERVRVNWDDPGFQGTFEGLALFPTAKEAASQTDAVLELCHLRPGPRVLDLGCGIGRHSPVTPPSSLSDLRVCPTGNLSLQEFDGQ